MSTRLDKMAENEMRLQGYRAREAAFEARFNAFNLQSQSAKDAPQVSFELKCQYLLCPSQPFNIHFTLQVQKDERFITPVAVSWNTSQLLTNHRILLIHKTKDDMLDIVDVELERSEDNSALPADENTLHILEPSPSGSHEFKPLTCKVGLPKEYCGNLILGDVCWFLWPGGVAGTLEYRDGEESRELPLFLPPARTHPCRPCAEMELCPGRDAYENGPGGLELANSKEQDWYSDHQRFPPPQLTGSADRVPGAPVFSCSITGAPSTYKTGPKAPAYSPHCKISLTYEHPGSDSRPDNRSIIFDSSRIFEDRGFDVLHHTPLGLGVMQSSPACRFGHWTTMDEDPPLYDISVPGFVELSPGESYSSTWNFCPDDELVEMLQVGETYTWQFLGGGVEWWDWGSLKDHEGKKIRADETSHGQRPKIIIPASNPVTFVVVK